MMTKNKDPSSFHRQLTFVISKIQYVAPPITARDMSHAITHGVTCYELTACAENFIASLKCVDSYIISGIIDWIIIRIQLVSNLSKGDSHNPLSIYSNFT